MVELGVDTFVHITPGPDGTLKRPDEVLREVVEQAVIIGGDPRRFLPYMDL